MIKRKGFFYKPPKGGRNNHLLIKILTKIRRLWQCIHGLSAKSVMKNNGKRNEQKVTEPYLVDALSFTGSRSTYHRKMTPFISGEFTVSDIKRPTIANCFHAKKKLPTVGSNANWFSSLDEKAVLRKNVYQVLVQAADLRDAVKKLDEGMKGTMADYQIASVAETAIMDVYPYSAEPDDKPEV